MFKFTEMLHSLLCFATSFLCSFGLEMALKAKAQETPTRDAESFGRQQEPSVAKRNSGSMLNLL
jgi:hypothetical protein